MGTRVTSAPIRAVIVEVIDSAVTSGELVRQGEMLAVAT
jgi:predicted RecA/RadA family phage recombinase